MKARVSIAIILSTVALGFALPFESSALVTSPVSFSSARASMACFPSNLPSLEYKKTHYNFNVSGGSAVQQAMLTGVLDRVAALGGEVFAKNIHVEIVERKSFGSPCASYTPGPNSIVLATCGRPPEEMAKHFAHELGHATGQKGTYSSYQRLPVCNITGYATNNGNANPRNEEFAEVFASYLGSPDALKTLCPEHFEWFHNNVFRGGPSPTEGCTGNPNPSTNVEGGAPYRWDESSDNNYSLNNNSMGSQLNNFIPMLQALTQQQNQLPAPPPAAPAYVNIQPINQPVAAPPPPVPVRPWPVAPESAR